MVDNNNPYTPNPPVKKKTDDAAAPEETQPQDELREELTKMPKDQWRNRLTDIPQPMGQIVESLTSKPMPRMDLPQQLKDSLTRKRKQ